jgi:ABC-2 type transport system permease protein
MASNSEFQLTGNKGRLQGFTNLLRNENRLWWRTSRWWVQVLIWLAIVNGILFMVIGIAPRMGNPPGEDSIAQDAQVYGLSGTVQESLAVKGLIVFMKMAGIAIGIGVVVLAQDTLIGEKQSGTAAWVLSKPIERSAFIIAKVISYSLGILMTMSVIQGGIAYLILFRVTGKAFPILAFAEAIGMLFLSLVFWLTLTVMLGALSNRRGLAIGIPLLLILGFSLFVEIAPWIANYMPWNLTSGVSGSQPAISVSLVLGQPITTTMPIIATIIGCLVFTLVAIWRFQREEF